MSKKNSIEEDLKIINNFITYFNKNIQQGNKADLTVLGEEIEALNHILSDYKRVLKENEELKEDRDKFKKALGRRITYCNELEKDLFENSSNYVIPKQIVKDKIEELKKKVEELTDEKGYWGGSDLLEQIKVLQELLEENENHIPRIN